MTAIDWLSEVLVLEATMFSMNEDAYAEAETRIQLQMNQLSEEEQAIAGNIYYFWIWNENGDIPEA